VARTTQIPTVDNSTRVSEYQDNADRQELSQDKTENRWHC